MTLSILYRGPLASCNYGCDYCPFAKRRDDRAALAGDRRALDRFSTWVKSRADRPLSIFFTPWGEALVRRWYRDAIVSLSHAENVSKVSIQTNLSASLAFLAEARANRVGFWCTYHPEWTSRARFLGKIAELERRGVSHSVGVVGMRRHLREISELRRLLPSTTYLWVNAVKSHGGGERYTAEEAALLRSIDPLFEVNQTAHASRGRLCRTGHSVVSVDGDGTVRRCHFVSQPIANLYEPGSLEAALAPRLGPNETCGCHIGYVHLEELELYRVVGEGLLERAARSELVTLRANARSSNRCGSSPSLDTPLR